MINRFSGKNRWLSNFWPCDIKVNGGYYPCVENAYQALKTLDVKERRRFERVSAFEAKRMGKGVNLRKDWESKKVEIMRSLVFVKFSDNEELRAKLLATGDALIVEGNTWGDTFWGECGGVGDNMLGVIIMQVRRELARMEKRDGEEG